VWHRAQCYEQAVEGSDQIKYFLTRLKDKSSSVPTHFVARPSFGYQDNLPNIVSEHTVSIYSPEDGDSMSSATYMSAYKSKRHYYPEDQHLYYNRHENLKRHIMHAYYMDEPDF
jgi:hypothetical protein